MPFTPIKTVTATINPALVAAATAVTQTFTLTGKGLTPQMVINHLWMPSLEAGITITNYYISAKDTLSVRFANVTAAGIDPALQTVKFTLG